MASRIIELRQKRATLAKQANEALDAAQEKATAEARGLTDEERKADDDFNAQISVLDEQIEFEDRKINRARLYGSASEDPTERKVPGSGPQKVTGVQDRSERDPRRGFGNPREFLLAAMKNSGRRDRESVRDERLRSLALVDSDDAAADGEVAFMLPAAFTPRSLMAGMGLQAAAGSDEQGEYDDRYGGFAVTPAPMRPGILQLGAEDDPTVGRTMGVPMSAPMVPILARTDKDHTSSVSGGFTVTRRPETVLGSGTRTQLERIDLRASSLFGFAFATEELLTDSPNSFAVIIENGFREQFAFHMLNEKIRGAGGNEYLGVLNSPALVTVTAVSGQGASTIKAQNVIDMRSRCWGYQNAIWIANHDTFPQLAQMAIIVGDAYGAGGIVMVYQSSSREDRPDMLLGRPIFYSESASALGTAGDLLLVNWSQYLEGLYQPLQGAESVHVRFLNHERAFKFWLRNAGAPWWRSELTPHKSSATLSPMVVLSGTRT